MSEPFSPDGELMLIDGNSLAYRAFFALPESIATADGFPTNALYGLSAMVIKVLIDERPSRVIVCWDAPGRTFRKERYEDYKAGRAATPDLLKEQSPHFRPLMAAFGFTNTELVGFEADDVIGTLATIADAAGERVTILTGDRDALQLVNDSVSVLATGRGVTDVTRYTPEKVEERYGVTPEQMTDYRGIVGDSSDNLPGVPGIGEKGAAQLIQKYGTLDEVLAHASEQTPKKKQVLTDHADDARLTRDLAVIVRDCPVEVDLDDVEPLDFDGPRLAEIRDLFTRFEFSSLARRLPELNSDVVSIEPVVRTDVRTITVDEIDATDLAFRLAGVQRVAVALADGRIAVTSGDGNVLVAAVDDHVVPMLASFLGQAALVAHDAKLVLRPLALGAVVPAHDTMVVAFLIEPRRRSYDLAELCQEVGLAVTGSEDAVANAAALTWLLAERQAPRMERAGVQELASTVELPLIPVLASMERAGITLDVGLLANLSKGVLEQIGELREQIWEHAGGEFVIDSPKQLGGVLFERLGLPTFRKGKTGWSTDRSVLKLLESKHPIVGLVGQYRELTKLQNTYLDALPQQVDPLDGRLHTTFNQTTAETGRLSSVNPNLQNIPVRTAIGREIRGAFVAGTGSSLVSLDYGQVELRILAHCSGEPVLRDALARGDDVHQITAAEVFGLPIEAVDRTTRDRAKAVNFGIIYGISDFGLSEQLSIPRKEAAEYIEAYLARYPLVRRFIDTTIADAARDGYVTTLLGRRRPIPELAGRTQQQRSLGERLAVNTVIQGTAADIIKVAMIRAHRGLLEAGGAARLVLQIHDELLVEVPDEEIEAAVPIVRDAMTSAMDLDPKLVVDVGIGASWLAAKA